MLPKITFVFILIKLHIPGLHSIVSNYGEMCNYTDECIDHRMICAYDDGILKCLCDRFHKWENYNIGCIPIYNVTTIINMTVTISDNIAELDKEQEQIFRGAVLAGFFVLSVGLGCSLSVIIYCIYKRKKNNRLVRAIRQLKKGRDQRKSKHSIPLV